MKEDVEIYHQFKQGREDAVTRFYNANKELFVKTIFKKKWGSMDDAERIYPQCVTILYYNVRGGKISLPLKASLSTYLITLGRNVMSNERRKAQHRNTMYVDPSILPENDMGIQNFDHLDYKEEAILMKRAMNSLGESCKKIINWFYIKGLSTETVAEKLDIEKLGTVRKKKHDCLKKLKKLFATHQAEIERYI